MSIGIRVFVSAVYYSDPFSHSVPIIFNT